MSLPNYLARIKSSGVYRFVWDKSVVPPQQAETLRLLIGYSEKGPFNTPVYIENVADFVSIYGNISKRLERRGVFFHRLAQQALQAGPILALNLKNFNEEKVQYLSFNPSQFSGNYESQTISVKDLYSSDRFWKLDEDELPNKISNNQYFNVITTDTKENSTTIFIRKYVPESYKGITLRSWYNSQNIEYPEYVNDILDKDLDQYFVEMYVFKGEFTPEICKGALVNYFEVNGETCSLKSDYVDVFGNEADALEYLSKDSNSNFIGKYQGCTLPYFKDAMGNYISIDIKVNADYNNHKLLVKLDESQLESGVDVAFSDNTPQPIYLEGYTYTSVGKDANIYDKCVEMFNDKGIRTALTNRVDVEYHYIIDTFGNKHNKKELFALASEKDNAFAIVNFPPMKSFAGTDGKIDIKGIFETGEFTLPGETEGASYGAYYTQLIFSDGTVKTTVPSAALVSNLFMEKWGPRQPYYIVAGPTYGTITQSGLVGPDYNYGRSDLDVLEPKGINAIIYVPRLGTYINSNQTAKQIPVSGLSKIHIRELVIYLQNEIEHLLQTYQWELNTQTLRDVIKSKADAICDTIMNNGGLYAFRNICDGSNNTPEVVDNEMIILDTEIEPARGAGKMVHQLTIHKTGAMSSTVK